MRNKVLVQRKIEELEDKIRQLDRLYRGVGTAYEMEQIYLSVKEKIEEISTLVNTEFEE